MKLWILLRLTLLGFVATQAEANKVECYRVLGNAANPNAVEREFLDTCNSHHHACAARLRFKVNQKTWHVEKKCLPRDECPDDAVRRHLNEHDVPYYQACCTESQCNDDDFTRKILRFAKQDREPIPGFVPDESLVEFEDQNKAACFRVLENAKDPNQMSEEFVDLCHSPDDACVARIRRKEHQGSWHVVKFCLPRDKCPENGGVRRHLNYHGIPYYQDCCFGDLCNNYDFVDNIRRFAKADGAPNPPPIVHDSNVDTYDGDGVGCFRVMENVDNPDETSLEFIDRCNRHEHACGSRLRWKQNQKRWHVLKFCMPRDKCDRMRAGYDDDVAVHFNEHGIKFYQSCCDGSLCNGDAFTANIQAFAERDDQRHANYLQ